jgi:hypothetical protein
MQSVSEIKLATTHIEFLDYLTKGMCGQMEISRDLIDNNGALNPASLLLIHCFYSFIIYLIHALSSVREISLVVHDIVHAQMIPILI